eukprot:551152-Karenia_brevis.AAC.1
MWNEVKAFVIIKAGAEKWLAAKARSLHLQCDFPKNVMHAVPMSKTMETLRYPHLLPELEILEAAHSPQSIYQAHH